MKLIANVQHLPPVLGPQDIIITTIIMHFQMIKGRLLYRIMSICCALSFAMYGYDAGVLGGVQTTKPFLDAMKVCNLRDVVGCRTDLFSIQRVLMLFR